MRIGGSALLRRALVVMPPKRLITTNFESESVAVQAAKRPCIDAVEHSTLELHSYASFLPASLEKRYKRFLGDVRLSPDSELTTLHVPNTGPMTGLLDNLPAPVMLSQSSNTSRKYAHTLEWIRIGKDDRPVWVGVNSAKANTFVKTLLQNNAIEELLPYTDMKPEVKFGSEKSRVDFVLDNGEQLCYVEVKSVTLTEDTADGRTIALFPDTVSVRAQRHVRELIKVVEKGNKAAFVFLIQRNDCDIFAPCYEKDPTYATMVAEAAEAGVKIIALACELDSEGGRVIYRGVIPVQLDYKRPQ